MNDIPSITRDELSAKIESDTHFYLVEALPAPYYRHTHLPGALNLPPDEVQECASSLLPDKNAEIVVYCAGFECAAAGDVARELLALGYANVRDYRGGKEEWMTAGLPVEGAARRHRR